MRTIKKPLYIQLSEHLIDQIINEMTIGDLLPSERKLAEIHDMSRTTVRSSINYLEEKGYLSTKHGKGSSVVDRHKKLINLSDMYSFTEQMKAIGKQPHTTLLDISIIDHSSFLKDIFDQKEKKLIKLVRIRAADGLALIYEESFIPYSKFHNIFDKRLNDRALYDVFLNDYNEIISFAQEEFSADLANEKVAKHLKIKKNSAILKIYRTTYNSDDEVIEYTNSKARPDKFTYRTIHYNRLD